MLLYMSLQYGRACEPSLLTYLSMSYILMLHAQSLLHAQYFAHLTAGSTLNGLGVIFYRSTQYFAHRTAGSTFRFSTQPTLKAGSTPNGSQQSYSHMLSTQPTPRQEVLVTTTFYILSHLMYEWIVCMQTVLKKYTCYSNYYILYTVAHGPAPCEDPPCGLHMWCVYTYIYMQCVNLAMGNLQRQQLCITQATVDIIL